METSFLVSTDEALDHFDVSEYSGLSARQVAEATREYGRNGMLLLNAEVA